jgi:hypothetical protein
MKWREHGGRLGARLAAAALLVAVAISQTGCLELLIRTYVAAALDYHLENPGDKRSDRYRFLEWRGKKKPGFQGQTFGIAAAPIFLRPPFTLEVRAGILDPGDYAASLGAGACLEVDQEGTFGQTGAFVFICADYVGSPSPGMTLRTSVDSNTMHYPWAYGGYLRLDADETTLTLQFRPVGAGTYDTLASAPIANPATGHYPSIGALGLYKGGVVNFSELYWTNTPPANPTQLQNISWDMGESLRLLNDAANALNGFDPNPSQASASIQASYFYIDSARANLEQFPDLKLGRQVLKKLDCLDKSAGKAFDEVQDVDLNGAIGKLGKGFNCGLFGLARLQQFDLRDF